MMKNTLFTPYNMNGISLENRFLMAPMTRSRATQPGDVPNKLMAEYYGQRASAGIIITEATQISLQGKGYAKTPGIYTQEQIEGWKLITKEVHQKGSKIFLQLWHVGRVSSSQVNGLQPLGPSAKMAKDTSVYIFDGAPNGDATFVPVETPKAMTKNELLVSDIGAEYHGYTADVTRTLPVNGKFSKEEAIIYSIVLKAQQAGIDSCKVGNKFWTPHNAATRIITDELIALGIIKLKATKIDGRAFG